MRVMFVILSVLPAQAGIHTVQGRCKSMDSRLRGNDGGEALKVLKGLLA
jgi:hypothetical protein